MKKEKKPNKNRIATRIWYLIFTPKRFYNPTFYFIDKAIAHNPFILCNFDYVMMKIAQDLSIYFHYKLFLVQRYSCINPSVILETFKEE